jgi:hypothetical protein
MATTDSPADDRTRNAQALEDKSTAVAILLALFVSPLAYYYVGRTKLAVINFLTLNYLLLGIVVVPVHTYKILADARRDGPAPN